MQNYYGYELKSHVIGFYEKENNNYLIHYLDGTTKKVLNANEDYELSLRKTMLRQLRDSNRDFKGNFNYLLHCNGVTFCTLFLTYFLSIYFHADNKVLLVLAEGVITLLGAHNIKDNDQKLADLKKAKLFILMQEQKDNGEMDSKLDRKAIPDINSLDNYSYADLKKAAKQMGI
jgi:hypothetical protein